MWLCLGKTLCNIEQFGQYPLQVNGFNNLDECLEGAMVEKEIESLLSDHSVTSGREVNSRIIKYLVFSLFVQFDASLRQYFLRFAEMVQKVTAGLDIWTVEIWIQHPARSSWKDTQETGFPTNNLYGQVSFAQIMES